MKRIVILAVFVAVVLTAAYTVITLYDTNLKIGRMWETPAVRPHERKMLIMAPGVLPFNGGEAEYRNAKGEDLTSSFKNEDSEIIASGKSLYFTYCAQCHGKYHDGNGTVGQSFQPLPGDLRSARVQSLSQGTIFKEISYGIPNGRQPALAPAYKESARKGVQVRQALAGQRQPAIPFQGPDEGKHILECRERRNDLDRLRSCDAVGICVGDGLERKLE